MRRQTTDPILLAARVFAQVTGEAKPKDPLAVELGRRGGLKGGKARAEKLSAARRKAIAKKGATARWGKRGLTGQSSTPPRSASATS